MKKTYVLEYDDADSGGDQISFEYNEEVEETIKVKLVNGVPTICANKTALKLLADTFIKMYLSDYIDGFHVHLTEDFDADKPEVLRVEIN